MGLKREYLEALRDKKGSDNVGVTIADVAQIILNAFDGDSTKEYELSRALKEVFDVLGTDQAQMSRGNVQLAYKIANDVLTKWKYL